MSRSYQKLTRFIAILLLIAVLGFPSSLCGQYNSLDTTSDLNSREWKIEGDVIYVPKFTQLSTREFPLKGVANVRGVWIIVPNIPFDPLPNSTASYTNTVTFSFYSVGPLLDNVNIKYNAAGNSTLIKMTGPTVLNVTDGVKMPDGWYTKSISLDHFWFQIEVTARAPGDFILIDRILVTLVEKRMKISGLRNDGCRPNQLAVAGIITVSCFLWNWNLL